MAKSVKIAAEKKSGEINDKAVTASSITKLLAFSIALVVLPISIYFITLNSIFNGNSTYAAISAALTANVVLMLYVGLAIYEDDDDSNSQKVLIDRAAKQPTAKEKKSQ
ncbi:hypothetical protein E3Q22_04121 [Wallemia mellicola]|uniref:Vacuolar ATPase assembly integral membrane protein VMA21 n=2 Tax=Wallemia mellicola TaxID=1708541 RepID=A0A4T0P2Z1_9BASI|nr:hypothetical protein E3Q23_04098 [Wallemia mellicola]TIB74525.1 hypothetical protein E3Q24_00491 [Wallemia mellicola]TIB74902.1 hypothetical protein E3Q22_04121 [Wallemia mellicola]TIB84703.1 hypothetical protein E3Q19_04381 [Wallemia mellicola]TIB89906.1 hypothetical protein E3Q21_00358 [Wallemia mellicola]